MSYADRIISSAVYVSEPLFWHPHTDKMRLAVTNPINNLLFFKISSLLFLRFKALKRQASICVSKPFVDASLHVINLISSASIDITFVLEKCPGFIGRICRTNQYIAVTAGFAIRLFVAKNFVCGIQATHMIFVILPERPRSDEVSLREINPLAGRTRSHYPL